MVNYFYIFGSVVLVSAISLVGVFFLSFSQTVLKKLVFFLVSLSAGTLIGDVFIHLIPEISAGDDQGLGIWFCLMGGLLIFFILEKIIHWRHCHVPTSQEHPHHLGMMNLVGDTFHNFFDGLIIAGSFLASWPLGLATLIAVIAHEIPQEIGNFGVLIYAGYSRRRALWLNFLTALSAILGAAVALAFNNGLLGFTDFILAFTAGGFIYIATADLIPELNKETRPIKSFLQLLFIVFGIFIMWLLKILFI
ncbi:MAG: ZIP family metal transporter [Patescibacteria group bacterium]